MRDSATSIRLLAEPLDAYEKRQTRIRRTEYGFPAELAVPDEADTLV